MNTLSSQSGPQRGAMGRTPLVIIAVILIAAAWMMLDEDAGRDIKKQAQLKTMEMMGDAAAKRMGGSEMGGEQTHGSAVDLIANPIEVREVTDNVYYATGVGNTIMVTTDEGNVLLDTGLSIQAAKQLRLLKEQVSDAPVTHIVLSHSHADHTGGTKIWREEGTEIVTHKDFAEEQRYLTELEPYLWQRNRRLFPWMPEEPTGIDMLAYGGIVPTITVDDEDIYRFSMGGVDFEVIGATWCRGRGIILYCGCRSRKY